MDEQVSRSLVERELSVLEKIELAGKLSAASLPLTYVSGYLIATSYLGTYGILLSSGDLFRAKYIYVGFQYLMFLVLIAAVFRVLLQIAGIWVRPPDPRTFDTDLALAAEVIRRRREEPSLRDRFRELRGDLVIGLVLLVFTVEIMLLNPEKMGRYLVLQVSFLVAVTLYQFTFYHELRKPYVWGLVHGRRYLEDVRWLLLNAQWPTVIGLILRASINNRLVTGYFAEAAEWVIWVAIFAAFQLEVLALPALFASRQRLVGIDDLAFFNPSIWESRKNIQGEILESLTSLRSLRGAWFGYFILWGSHARARLAAKIVLLIPLGAVLVLLWAYFHGLLHQQTWLNAVLVGTVLILSLTVLLNVGFLTASATERARLADLDRRVDARSTQREKWENYARRVAMATVLYITSVLSFSYVVYPHIPAQKAGGNYSTVKSICVHLVKATPAGECRSNLLPPLEKHEAYVALEQDADWIYLVNDHSGGGPHRWSFPGFGTDYSRPRVYAISRSCIASVEDALAEGQDQRCSTP